MPFSLAQGAMLSNDVVLSGLFDLTINDDDLLSDLMFDEVNGTAFTKVTMTTEPTVNHYLPNEVISEDVGEWTSAATSLKIAIGDADIDEFMQQTYKNVQDLKTAILAKKLKAMLDKISYMMIYGSEATYLGLAGDTRYPTGLRKAVTATAASAQVIAAGATGAVLTLDMVDELLDLTRGGRATHLLMPRALRRKLMSLARVAGNNLQVREGRLGQLVSYYGDAKICISDHMLMTHTLSGSAETKVVDGACGTIYALRLGHDGFRGRINGGGVLHKSIGSLETKDAERERFKCYYNFDVLQPLSCAALIGAKVA